MWLTGHAEGPPLAVDVDVMGFARRWLSRIAGNDGAGVDGTATALFGRAALAGLSRHGRSSANGSCRLFETVDGWLAVNLARPSDVDAVAAIVEQPPGHDPWEALVDAGRNRRAADLADRAQLLGVPAARMPARTCGTEPLHSTRLGPSSPPSSAPLVVDLSSMWAGPLCARLLGRHVGARVIKVEATSRPDGGRAGDPTFFDWLHGGHASVAIDLTLDEGVHHLRTLVEQADVVLESSRPRALLQLGIDAGEIVARSPGMTWVSITGYGRTGDAADRVAFGDDAAVAGGLVARDAGGHPVFLGDAIADPLTGIVAASAAAESIRSGGGRLLDVAMQQVSAHAVASSGLSPGPTDVTDDGDGWVVRHGNLMARVQRPPRPHPTQSAEALGASTASVLGST
ncbi:MAG TPA: CoA transferase [Acidimicrobiales bacterium]